MASVFPAIITLLYMSASFFLSLVALNISPSQRTLPLILLVTFAILAFRRVKSVSPTPECEQLFGLFVLIWLVHISSVLCVEQYVIKPAESGKWQWVKAYKMLFNARWIRTPRPAPDVFYTVQKDDAEPGVKKSSQSTESQGNTQSRASDEIRHAQLDHLKCPEEWSKTPMKAVEPLRLQKFLLKRAFSLLVIYTASRVYYSLLSPNSTIFKPLAYSDFSPSKQVFLRRLLTSTITSREIIIRTWAVFTFIFSNWTYMTGAHDILSLLFVGILRVDDPEEWPQLFGSITNAYTIKGFWGSFWHSLVYRAYTSWAKLLSQRVFRIKPNNIVGKIVINFLVFFFSGATHAIVSMQLGYRCGVWEEVVWFCGNFFAMMVEGVVQGMVKRLFTGKEDSRGYQITRKAVGFLWVFSFFFWSLPKSHYPRHYCGVRG